jgi:hypothetical protein
MICIDDSLFAPPRRQPRSGAAKTFGAQPAGRHDFPSRLAGLAASLLAIGGSSNVIDRALKVSATP